MLIRRILMQISRFSHLLMNCFFLGLAALAADPVAMPPPVVPAVSARPALPQADVDRARVAAERLAAWHKEAPANTAKLYVFYVCMADLDPHPEHAVRLDRVLKEIQGFYRNQMEMNGFGQLTFPVELDKDGKLVIHVVRSKKPKAAFGRDSGQAILDEIQPAIKEAGIDSEHSTLLILTPLPEGAPYYGSGSFRSGVCWATDFPHLDPLRFTDKTPEPKNVFKRNVGQDNSVYIGGITHELGHAFGLPHNNDRPKTVFPGTSLMGAGNYTYREELRNEGAGTFLSPVDAFRLASHPLFSGVCRGIDDKSTCRFSGLDVGRDGQDLLVTGQVAASPDVYAVVAYNDPGECPDSFNPRTGEYEDYDANSFVSVPDRDGKFSLRMNILKNGSGYGLRLVACHLNGDATHYPPVFYTVSRSGEPETAQLRRTWMFADFFEVLAAGKMNEALASLEKVEKTPAADADAKAWVVRFRTMLQPLAPAVLAQLPVAAIQADLAACEWESATVGWGQPLRNQVYASATEFPLQVRQTWYAQGLYAHAPATYAFRLNGGWKRFAVRAGVQDGHPGTVQFQVVGDGKVLSQSPVLKSGTLYRFEVTVEGVDKLELRTTDGGDGNGSDWGVWLDPTVSR
jgi:hypothetical protein